MCIHVACIVLLVVEIVAAVPIDSGVVVIGVQAGILPTEAVI